ncbi:DUF4232 domain-containing protein [Streptomyces griseus]|uniref:DUF4232 domain-containing protein n=1 Tax=Streptomyces stephensoniae TaxID=3375367 RepID=A0ABU2VW69_9ACTN|nr:DUF4232 domain-containing protein [Streptomyces griseus]MDT0489845.1 DUF4232 domain-containing protein [Streptomyces griseus]
MRRTSPLRPAPFLSAVAVTALLLTACGTERAGVGDTGGGGGAGVSDGAGSSSSSTPVDDPGKDGVRVTSLTLPSVPASPSASPSPSHGYAVSADRLAPDTGAGADFEVTNESSEKLTYTVIITFTSDDGGAMANETATVRDVGPGKTVRGTVRAEGLPPGAPRITGAKVLQVTKVPASEAPAEPGTCPASGIRVSADQGDAAMGLRVVGLHLENCGTRDYTVQGYPLLRLLDHGMKPVDGIEILDGSGEITTGAGPDEPPRPVTLGPGETATAGLVWRNTTESGTPVNVPYVQVRAKAGAEPVTVTPGLDLGTTGKLGVRPWKKTDAEAQQGGGAAGTSGRPGQ